MKSNVKLVIGLTIFYVFYIIIANNVFGETLQLQSSGQGSTNYDEFISSQGAKCRQAMGSNLNAEIGVGTGEERNLFEDSDGIINPNSSQNVGLFARITYAIGAPKRLDCTRIYELELLFLREQIKKLQQ